MTEVIYKIKPLGLTIALGMLILGLFMFFAPIGIDAQSARDAACEGVALTGGSCDTGASEGTVNKTLGTVITIFSFVVGFVAVIMIIIGGLKYITSAGDSSSVNSAKNTILYAIIGLVVVALAQVIVRFVLNQV